MAQPLAAAISDACPRSPKPVMSVQARTDPDGRRSIACAAALFKDVIDAIAAVTAAVFARSNFSAVAITPVPSGLVRIKTSPGLAPALVRIRAGSMIPVIA